MGRRQAAGAAQLRSIRRRWSAHRCRPLAAHRPLFLAVPEIDDEDRLGAGVIHPDDSPGGGSSGDSGTVGEGVSCRGAEGPAGWTRHQESLVVAGPAFPFCACFASGGWARLSGPARFSATEPVAGGPTKRSARTRPISITKTTRRTAAETLAPPATCGLRSPGRRPSDRSLSRLNRPLLAHPCRCVSLQRPKFDARGNTLATSLVARCRHTGVSAPRGN